MIRLLLAIIILTEIIYRALLRDSVRQGLGVEHVVTCDLASGPELVAHQHEAAQRAARQ